MRTVRPENYCLPNHRSGPPPLPQLLNPNSYRSGIAIRHEMA